MEKWTGKKKMENEQKRWNNGNMKLRNYYKVLRHFIHTQFITCEDCTQDQ